MDRRAFLLLALAGCGAGLEELPLPKNMAYQSELTLHRHAAQPLLGDMTSGIWRHAGNALSATSGKLFGEYGLSRLLHARLVIAWTPNDNGYGQTGVRIALADDGPTNFVTAFQDLQTGANPRVSWTDLAPFLNANVIDARVNKQILLQTLGNGEQGPQVYAAWIDLVWS